MKKNYLIICFFISHSIYGQTIELQGSYSASFIGAETINFVGKDSFYFNAFYCTNGFSGKGRCEITNNLLYLYFEKNQSSNTNDSFKIDKIKKSESLDSFALIKITCIDENGTPIPGATITTGKPNSIYRLNEFGNAEFKIKKNAFPLELNITCVGFDRKVIKLTEPFNYTINANPGKSKFTEILNKGEVYIYDIEEITEEYILMDSKNTPAPKVTYKRRGSL